jgi:cold shock CspA family protein
MVIGICIAWDRDRGFGFVRADGDNYFVHQSEVADRAPLERGALVQFTPTTSVRGVRAIHVRPIAPDCGKCGARLTALTCGDCGWSVDT